MWCTNIMRKNNRERNTAEDTLCAVNRLAAMQHRQPRSRVVLVVLQCINIMRKNNRERNTAEDILSVNTLVMGGILGRG